ncbi:ferrous iron transport protein B [Lactiplantibacillus pentosus]|uniref:Ferrous iron transport protein B n=1 Tax=Lactiplantibacillus pentosus TaxID=1589 RepID=A0AB37RM26_LACPE|nr:ferrous iron transport protein B [Lactiplantibacillus pentosus]RMW47548.1 ferrous iron transport protein B [Lactiplantibacillus pentosus]RMW49348.1 ferrous iron transport protein B [Lactiplantibacillus pentosus]RMW54558.1 ferrous iron transport protein B [Lactiplantibacillus pentosus]RMW57456.1 ferrous iron transport protein B [Lactiplantibacillus pentosus]
MTTVALLGNPNTGKTTLFNELTDKYAYVGNWTGVTVEKKMGRIRHSEVEVVDLPGVYSLNPITKDEAVVTNYLLHNHPDLILNVTNASQLKRNLLLSIEVLEFGAPVIIALNMIDDLKRTGHYYDFKTLAQQLGCQIKATNARNKEGLTQLREELLAAPTPAANPLKLNYPFMIEQAIRQASNQLVNDYDCTPDFARWLTIQFINQNKRIRTYAKQLDLKPLLSQAAYYDAQQFDDQIFQTRLTFIEQTLASASQNLASTSHVEMTAKIDKWITHPLLGLPVFVGIFYLMFKLSFDWIGTPLSDLLDGFVSGPLSTTVSHWLTVAGAIPILRSLIVNGLIAGVGGVLVFIPQIFVLFACISILEDSGYMARAALVTDRLMQMIGLNGKAFIPLIIGFGCNVTGIMAARTIEQPKERLITTLISPFMSCSARLPIYSLFVAAFFPSNQALIVLSIYFLGIAVALAMAKFYQVIFNVDDSSVFIVELPQYHIPRADIIWRGTWDKGKGFIKKAGTIIFAGTVLIWLLSSFGTNGLVNDIDRSFAATLGKTLLPLFAPLGVTAWQVISALFTGILAKEVISSSMMVMFHSANQAGLIAMMGRFFTPLSAYAMLVFILLYVPCFATIGTIKSETGSTKWAVYSVFSSLAIAYGLAFIIYQVGSLFI